MFFTSGLPNHSNSILLSPDLPGSLPSRENIDGKYTWDLTHIYPTIEKWDEDFLFVERNFPVYKEFEGKISDSGTKLLELLNFDEKISTVLERLYLYAMLSRDTDLRVAQFQSMDARIKSLHTKVAKEASFIRPELLTIEEEALQNFAESVPGLKMYEHFFKELFRTKAHTLSKELEEILSATAEMSGIAYDTFSIFNNADLQFPTSVDENGKEIKVSHGRYQAALYSKNREYRERMFKAYYKPYTEYANTLSTLFNGNLKNKIFYANSRKYISAREASLDRNNIPVRVYDNLIAAVSNNLEPMHRWMALKKKLLGLQELHPYDAYTGIFTENQEKKYSYEESVQLVKDSLVILGQPYQDILNEAFSNRWIDVHESQGKRSGAYSSGTTYGVHPYVLLNWVSLLNDVFTLAHEMGHNVHSYLTGKYQPFVYADYSIFLAEIASTFNESLLLDHLIKSTNNVNQKLVLYERYLNNASATFYRQTMFAEFEMKVYDETESGKALTPESLCEMYKSVYQKYMGPDMVIDKEEEYTWARVPHFYYNFYVFQYATGFAASETLALKVLNGTQKDVDAYLDFLKAGKSDYPLNILRNTGVDMASPEPVAAVSKKMTAMLDEVEKIIAAGGIV